MAEKMTPVRQQYLRIKRTYPGALVLFRLGDFYETFDEDARITSRELEIVLTSREMGKDNKVPMAGIPYHALDSYLARLINRGYKVAICEQMTRPGETKGIVEREVIRLVTPGTVVEPALLDSQKNNYLVSLVLGEEAAGLAYVDITTSEFGTTELPLARLPAELQRLKPSEIILAKNAVSPLSDTSIPVTRIDDYRYELDTARQALLDHFGVATLDGFGCAHLPLAVRAAGAIVHYLQETQKSGLAQLTRLSTYSTESFMALDAQTQRNLELFQSSRTGLAGGSLLAMIDLTKTPLGGRRLKKWLSQPLLDIKELSQRQDAIAWFYENTLARRQIVAILADIADLERLINRVRGGIALPRELVTLRRSLETVPRLSALLVECPLEWLKSGLKPLPEVLDLIGRAVVDEPSSTIGEGEVIRRGFATELDSLRDTSHNARQYLANVERQEREKTGIKSLKIGFNNVFGYYIEVSKANLAQVPPEYIRKQTLANGERFFTPELKEYESLILNARDRIVELETALFKQVCQQVAAFSEPVLALADALAHLDVFSSLAQVAVQYHYVRPELNTGNEIKISSGRHPVVERSLTAGSFVPNDTHLSNDDAQLIVLTGPNMSGKSTYLRQVALIVLLAQIGSFVPAEKAGIGIVDRIFTRIGAGEDIAAGQSTFMVEMVETASILNNATPRSLIILDEIGRGTSTYDGLSIARAVAEHIHSSPRLGSKTLFATHYHEMVGLAGFLPRVKNFNVAVAEEGGVVTFLYKIVPGGVDKSYGIHVAQLAGLPKAVVRRAREVLDELEGAPPKPSVTARRRETVQQIPLFGQKSPLLEEMSKLDINALTPLEALNKLYELQKKARES